MKKLLSCFFKVRDIIATATKNQNDYRASVFAAVSYLHRLGVHKKLQNKVKLWLSYTWEQQKTLGMHICAWINELIVISAESSHVTFSLIYVLLYQIAQFC